MVNPHRVSPGRQPQPGPEEEEERQRRRQWPGRLAAEQAAGGYLPSPGARQRDPERAAAMELEMEQIRHDRTMFAATGTPSPPSSGSRQAWSRDNPGFEPEEGEMGEEEDEEGMVVEMDVEWHPPGPGRRSGSVASSCSSSGGAGVAGYPSGAHAGRGRRGGPEQCATPASVDNLPQQPDQGGPEGARRILYYLKGKLPTSSLTLVQEFL
ncbi:hypothetical protein NDU88_006344 [Pleurodeles waltl]|uniref:Uncharacterized protein n=1 Tax=Pleurodeles waltl TaxID=8319 RepID=A0AAV7X2B8_PLEWA|nr:hypothetical protein NDU88_006344 [Pleurodeles waltl]